MGERNRLSRYLSDLTDRYAYYKLQKSEIEYQYGYRSEQYKGHHAIKVQPWMVDRVFPLDSALLSRMEVLFDYDFKSVRIHLGPVAESVTSQQGASAVTMGSDIYFSEGAFEPHKEQGLVLLAHELEHVKQFASGRSPLNDEDRASLEGEAYRLETMIKDNFHNLEPSSLDSGLGGNFSSKGQGGELHRSKGSGAPDLLEDFINQPRYKMVEVVMENTGSRYNISPNTLKMIQREVLEAFQADLQYRFSQATEEEKREIASKLMSGGYGL
ncbi:MAG: DUF4157 domain-containing protein [Spirochaetales bacterium]|nr:DUF4157 domain-containing protein [Spirochaetales bacterium]